MTCPVNYLICFAAAVLAFTPTQAVPATGQAVTFQINTSHNGVQSATALAPPFAQRWQVSLPGPVSYPLIAQGMVFVTVYDANSRSAVYALDQVDGHVLWSYEMPRGTFSYPWSAAAYDGGRIFATSTDGILYALDASTGSLNWSVAPPGQYLFSSAPTASNGVVYTAGAGGGGTVYSFDESTGGLLATAGVMNGDHSSPALSSNAVFVSYACNQDYAFSLSSLTQLWHHSTGCEGGGGRTSVYDGGRLYTRDWASTGNLILDATTAAELGSFSLYSPAIPAVNGNRLWMLSGTNLTALDVSVPAAPATKWDFTGDGGLVTAPIVLSGSGGDWVIVGSSTGMLYAIDAATGRPVWNTNIGTALQGTDEQNVSRPMTGLSASQDLLVVPAGNVLTAFGNVPPTGYFPLTPARLLDTRPGYSTIDGLFAGNGPVGNGSALSLQVTGRAGVPASGVTAVVINLTATQPAGAGYVTVWPTDMPLPNASNLNFTIGQTIPNLVIVPIASDGSISLYASKSTHLIVDIEGYFTSQSAFTPTPPARLLDTRNGYTTTDGLNSGSGALAGSARVDLTIAGRAGVPLNLNGTVVMNVTATGPTQDGYLMLWATGQAAPATSNLNFASGQTIAHLAIVQTSNTGQVSIFNSAGSTDVIADLLGWFPSSSDFIPVDPQRILDSRPGMTTTDGQYAAIGAIGPQGRLDLSVLGRAGVPSIGVGAVVVNLTATQATANAYVTAWPSDAARPAASNLNVGPGQSISNLVICKVGADGKIAIFNSAGSTHLIADIVGWFPAAH